MLKLKNIVGFLLALITIINAFAIAILLPHYLELWHQFRFTRDSVVTADIDSDIFLSPMGLAVGIKVNTEGVVVLGVGSVTDSYGRLHSPAKELQAGDHILFANNIKLQQKEDLMEIINEADQVELVMKRNGEIITLALHPIADNSGMNKLGIWVRDTAQGIGTITYYNPQSGKFGALGHGIVDANTKDLMEIKQGEVSLTHIESIKKGKKGNPGELVGYLDKENNVLGDIKINTDHGIFGYLKTETLKIPRPIPIALSDQVVLGEANMISNVDGQIKSYKVNIESLNKNSLDNSKGMVIKIVDDFLLDTTNGIVQGMSGSPLIQNGKIIGAITHVFVQDPTKGYGVFIENMLKQENNI